LEKHKLTTKDLMLKYNKTIGTIYNWIKAGLPYEKVNEGRRIVYRFDETIVKEWLKNNSRT